MNKMRNKIAAAYEGSAWARLWFLAICSAIIDLRVWLVLSLLGDGPCSAGIVAVWIVVGSCVAAYIAIPVIDVRADKGQPWI